MLNRRANYWGIVSCNQAVLVLAFLVTAAPGLRAQIMTTIAGTGWAFPGTRLPGVAAAGPAGVDGKVNTPPLPRPILPVSVKIGGVDSTVDYVGAASGLIAGVIQINVRVPSRVGPGAAVPVTVSIGSVSNQTGITMAVR